MRFKNKMEVEAGVNLVPAAGDIASPANGDIWYNSTTTKFRKKENGVITNMDTGTSIGLSYMIAFNYQNFLSIY